MKSLNLNFRFPFFPAASVLLIAVLLAACANPEEMEPIVDDDTPAPSPAAWTYEGTTGPDRWGDLSDEFAVCSEGMEQSPINLTAWESDDLPTLTFNYEPTAVTVEDKGYTLQVAYDAGSQLMIDDRAFNLVQFHLHTPSEHTLNGESFPAELHLVHADANGNLAVVGIMLQEGAANPSYDAFLNHIPTAAGATSNPDGVMLDANDLLPSTTTYLHYDGSLTTPPCSEGVLWHVLTEPVTLSPAQMDKLEVRIPNTNRPVQPLHERDLLSSGS